MTERFLRIGESPSQAWQISFYAWTRPLTHALVSLTHGADISTSRWSRITMTVCVCWRTKASVNICRQHSMLSLNPLSSLYRRLYEYDLDTVRVFLVTAHLLFVKQDCAGVCTLSSVNRFVRWTPSQWCGPLAPGSSAFTHSELLALRPALLELWEGIRTRKDAPRTKCSRIGISPSVFSRRPWLNCQLASAYALLWCLIAAF